MFVDDDYGGSGKSGPTFKPVPGDNVHFYTRDASRWCGFINEGPYAAMVTRVHPTPAGAPFLVSLTVFPPMLPPYCVPNVPAGEIGAETTGSCWWTELPL